jgi:outer membrane protein
MASEPVNIGLSVSLTKPLSDGGLRKAQEQEQEAAIADLKLQVESLKHDISLNVRQSILSVTEAREQLRVAEAGETNAREQLRLAQIRYAAGLTTGVEVLDAETALASAETSTVNARYDLQTAVGELHQAVGDLTALAPGAP